MACEVAIGRIEVVRHGEGRRRSVVNNFEHIARASIVVRQGHIGHFVAAFLDKLNVQHILVLAGRGRRRQSELSEGVAAVLGREQSAFQSPLLDGTCQLDVGIGGALLHGFEFGAIVKRHAGAP